MMDFPNQISFLSDDSQVKLVKEVINKQLKERLAIYVFTHTRVPPVREFMMSLSQIEKLNAENLIVCK